MKANVGMVYPVMAPVNTYTPGTSITYSAGSIVGEARSATVNWDVDDSEFYGDDVVLDTANGTLGYTIEFEPTGLTDAIRNKLLGETKSSSEYSITNAASPMVGFGYIRVMREPLSGTVTTVFEAWWYYRVQFGMTSEETRTKEKNLEWRTPTLSGKGTGVQLSAAETLTFAVHQTFTTLAAARSWLNSKASIT